MTFPPDSPGGPSKSTISLPVTIQKTSGQAPPSMDTAQYLLQCAEEDRAELNDYLANPTQDATTDDQIWASFTDCSMWDPVRRAPAPFHISTCLNWGCAKSGCTRTKNLSPCSACNAVLYCTSEHQRLGRPDHRLACTKVMKAQKFFFKEERLLRENHGVSVFDEQSSTFAQVNSFTYSAACSGLARTLFKSSNAHSCSIALDLLVKLARLKRNDLVGLRDVIPSLYIRLGQDQKAFDFCYWWATTGQQRDYDWLAHQGVFLDTQKADVLHEAQVFTGLGITLSQIAAITLIKIRLMIDLQAIYRANQLAGPRVPQEVLDVILEHVTYSSVFGASQNIKQADIGRHIASLREQIIVLYEATQRANPHFWPALIEPGNNLTVEPSRYQYGEIEHMQLALQNTYNAWSESPGSIDVIKSYQKARLAAAPV